MARPETHLGLSLWNAKHHRLLRISSSYQKHCWIVCVEVGVENLQCYQHIQHLLLKTAILRSDKVVAVAVDVVTVKIEFDEQ